MTYLEIFSPNYYNIPILMLYLRKLRRINRYMKQERNSNNHTLVIVIVELIIVFFIIKGI